MNKEVELQNQIDLLKAKLAESEQKYYDANKAWHDQNKRAEAAEKRVKELERDGYPQMSKALDVAIEKLAAQSELLAKAREAGLVDMNDRNAFKEYCDGNRAPWVERLLSASAYRMLTALASPPSPVAVEPSTFKANATIEEGSPKFFIEDEEPSEVEVLRARLAYWRNELEYFSDSGNDLCGLGHENLCCVTEAGIRITAQNALDVTDAEVLAWWAELKAKQGESK